MHFLANYPCDTLPVKKPPLRSQYSQLETCQMDPCNRSTLQVRKENGQYLICMNPLKDSENLKPGENPYLSCPPITFKIEKDPEQQKLDHCRDELKKIGFCECTCVNPCACKCRTATEKQLLSREMNRLSKEVGLQMPMRNEDFTVNDEEEGDNNVNIEFTPPSAAIGKKRKISKKDTVATETQYNDKDFLWELPGDRKLINAGKDDKDIGAGKSDKTKGVGSKKGAGKNGVDKNKGSGDRKGTGKDDTDKNGKKGVGKNAVDKGSKKGEATDKGSKSGGKGKAGLK